MEPEELRIALEIEFPQANVDIYRIPGTRRVGGHIVSDEFDAMDHFARQERLWRFLQNHFGPQTTQISSILTYSRKEYDSMTTA